MTYRGATMLGRLNSLFAQETAPMPTLDVEAPDPVEVMERALVDWNLAQALLVPQLCAPQDDPRFVSIPLWDGVDAVMVLAMEQVAMSLPQEALDGLGVSPEQALAAAIANLRHEPVTVLQEGSTWILDGGDFTSAQVLRLPELVAVGPAGALVAVVSAHRIVVEPLWATDLDEVQGWIARLCGHGALLLWWHSERISPIPVARHTHATLVDPPSAFFRRVTPGQQHKRNLWV